MAKIKNAKKVEEQVVEEQFDFLLDDGLGGDEQLNADVMSFPFVRILQALSPQCKKNSSAYVEGASEGMLYNNIANEAIDPPARVIVAKFERYFIEWKPNRGGFAGAHTPEEVEQLLATGNLERNERNQIMDPRTGNTLSDTYTYYVLFPDKVEWGVCLLCLSSTQLKEARRWNRMLTSTFLPGTATRARIYHTIWNVTTPEQSNDRGSWAGFHVEFSGFINKGMMEMATNERKALSQNTGRLDLQAIEGTATEAIEASAEVVEEGQF